MEGRWQLRMWTVHISRHLARCSNLFLLSHAQSPSNHLPKPLPAPKESKVPVAHANASICPQSPETCTGKKSCG